MRWWRSPYNLVFGLVIVLLAAWRLACVRSGPDIDTDAYAHHMIARAILADPRDLAVHWVWLPLFHYLQVPLVALGGTMDELRWINVALSAALPIVLFAYVGRTAGLSRRGPTGAPPALTALLAATFAAASPIAMQMGTTAQPEPLFALLMLGVAIESQQRRHLAAAGMLGAAVMLRYEAWATLASLAAVTAGEAWRHRHSGEVRSPRQWLVLAIPAALILAWATLRRPVDGRWFGFLGQTREFATSATHEQTAFDGGALRLLRDAVYYPVLVPARVMGPALVLAPLGIPRTVREQGGRFVLVLAACLAFVSLTWVMRSSLGLDRHFVVVIALYATFAAQGVTVIADATARLARRIASEDMACRIGFATAALVSGFAGLWLGAVLRVWMGFWQASIERGWPDRAAIGAYLRSLPDPGALVFCDDATIEILSRLDRSRFDRHWVDDDHTWSLIAEAAQTHGVAYVATWNRKLAGHGPAGRVVFVAGQTAGEPESGVAVMRVTPRAGGASLR